MELKCCLCLGEMTKLTYEERDYMILSGSGDAYACLACLVPGLTEQFSRCILRCANGGMFEFLLFAVVDTFVEIRINQVGSDTSIELHSVKFDDERNDSPYLMSGEHIIGGISNISDWDFSDEESIVRRLKTLLTWR